MAATRLSSLCFFAIVWSATVSLTQQRASTVTHQTSPASIAPVLQVIWLHDRLSVVADRVPLTLVLDRIARRTGLNLEGRDAALGQIVSARFAGLALKPALENLLASTNYMIQELAPSAGDHQLRVVILGPRNASGQPDIASQSPGQAGDPGMPVGAPGLSSLNQKPSRKACPTSGLQQLCDALDDPDPAVRAAAVEEFSRLAPEAAQALRASLPDDRKAEIDKLQSLQSLSRSRDADAQTVLSALADGLKDRDSAVQAFAVQSLAERGGNAAVSYLREAFRDLDTGTRMLVVESVAPNDGAEQILQDAAQDPDENVRAAASDLLGQLTPSNAGKN